MRKIMIGLLVLSGVVGRAMCAETLEMKAQKMVKSVQEGCKQELTTFCKDVTPGEGRLLACLYAFQDKLTSQCEYVLYDAATKLEQAVVKLQHVANQCSGDIDKFCSAVQPGEGRIINCLKKNEKKIAPSCSQAMKDTEMKK